VDTVWRALADVVVGFHYAFMGFLVVGGFLAWRWRWLIWAHVVAVVWAVLIVTTHIPCPLTALQNHLREMAGQRPLSDSFINLYIRGTFYPEDQQPLGQAVLGVVVLTAWIGFVRLRPRQQGALTGERAGAASR
jgi:uncharacterized protein DUF2784